MKDFAILLAIQVFNFLQTHRKVKIADINKEVYNALFKMAFVGSSGPDEAAEKLNMQSSNFCQKMKLMGYKFNKKDWREFKELDTVNIQKPANRRMYAGKKRTNT